MKFLKLEDSVMAQCSFETLKKALKTRIEWISLKLCKKLLGDEFEHK